MKSVTSLLLAVLIISITSCSTSGSVDLKKDSIFELTTGIWRGALNISNDDQPLELPFNFEVISNNKILIHNGEERIEVTDVIIEEHSLSIKMPVFGSEFKLSNTNEVWEGEWHNYNKKDYKLPFRAIADNSSRFEQTATRSTQQFAKRWKVMFSPNTNDAYPAIGLFERKEDGTVTGTFLTETGDYRYLEGTFDGNTLNLSCFDGAHAFLFRANLQEDGSLKGKFWSGKHWQEPWIATPNKDFQLAEMDKLTFLKEGYDKLAFSFPNTDGEMISLEDEQFQGKPTIVQITGSWCPNCMDETRFFVDIYDKYKSKGLKIIAIDYEIVNTMETFVKSQKRMEEHLGVNYPVVFGGLANKSEAIKTLPMLNHIMSYPTAIFIDKEGTVRKIHTGFSGPGTGELYEKYTAKTIALIETLISE
jgi:thiol-disulfide isomerase/thioredoxin